RHGIVDSTHGVVQKINQDSVPIDLETLKKINTEHRNNAEYYFQMTKDYLCSVKDCAPISQCNVCDCVKDCLCNSCKKCKEGRTLQDRGYTFKNITKFD